MLCSSKNDKKSVDKREREIRVTNSVLKQFHNVDTYFTLRYVSKKMTKCGKDWKSSLKLWKRDKISKKVFEKEPELEI